MKYLPNIEITHKLVPADIDDNGALLYSLLISSLKIDNVELLTHSSNITENVKVSKNDANELIVNIGNIENMSNIYGSNIDMKNILSDVSDEKIYTWILAATEEEQLDIIDEEYEYEYPENYDSTKTVNWNTNIDNIIINEDCLYIFLAVPLNCNINNYVCGVNNTLLAIPANRFFIKFRKINAIINHKIYHFYLYRSRLPYNKGVYVCEKNKK